MRFVQRTVCLIIAGAWSVCFFSGCAKAPDAELAAAREAVKAALDVEADKYMAKNFQNVQRALETAEAEIAKQKQSFFLTRKYKRVTEMLEKTVELATEIKNETPKIKEDMVAQVKENLGLVKGMLQETANDIKKAPRSTDKSVIAELKADLNVADSAAIRAAADFEAGHILGASENLDEVQRLMKKITDTLKPKTEE
ncbi:MAG: hypothetical protein JXA18_06815 [Chitinispirillaceae bacterium]|nr:hypothetical protein [Chitinispirillaceae bacterium]